MANEAEKLRENRNCRRPKPPKGKVVEKRQGRYHKKNPIGR